MNELVKNVMITSAIIGGIRLYGKVKYIQGVVDTNKALANEFEKREKRKRTSYFTTDEGR